MNVFRNLPIARKLLVGFGAVCLLTALLGGVALISFHKVSGSVNDIVNNALPSVQLLADIRIAATSLRRTDANIALCESQACVDTYQARRQKFLNDYHKAVDAYAPLVSYDGERELFKEFRGEIDQYLQLSDQFQSLIKANKVQEARALFMADSTAKLFDAYNAAIAKDQDLNRREASNSGARASSLIGKSTVAAWSTILLALGISVLVGVFLTRTIAPPLVAATEALERVAHKDLTVQVEVNSSDEVGRLSKALNQSVEATRDVLGNIAMAAETLSSATEELSVRSQQTSGNAKTQSSSTNQIAAAAQEMVATIGEISHNAEEATRVSRQSADSATQGGQVMQNANATMERISDTSTSVAERMGTLARRSEEIGQVVTVIQGISEQTNLLALNAAIEAARAGEHGRGFAVVAGEVRRLAERTKSATEEIAGTIRAIQEETKLTVEVMEGSRAEVQVGMTETADAQRALASTIELVQGMEHMISLIATAATEQTAASQEISESAGQISRLAEENAIGADETASACHNLTELANNLDGMIRQFNMGSGQGNTVRLQPTYTAVNSLHRPLQV